MIAAIIIGFTGDVGRFRAPDAYAAYNATAPVEVSFGDRQVHRLSRRGNRQLNHAATGCGFGCALAGRPPAAPPRSS